MAIAQKMQTDVTRGIERLLRKQFPTAECYQYNIGAIRIRIVDDRFAEKSQLQRERMVLPLLKALPGETQADITMLALLTEDEKSFSLVSLEFDDPRPSRK